MYYYLVEGAVCCSLTQYRDLEPLAQPQKPDVYLFEGDPRRCRASFALTQPGLLTAGPESVAWLDRNSCPEPARLDEPVREAFRQGGLRAVNRLCPDWKKLLRPSYKTGKKRLNLLAMGDVGGTLLTGLRLLGSDVIESIGICDLNEKAAARWEFEANQIAYPWEYDALPPVEIISPEEFFRCDGAVRCRMCGWPSSRPTGRSWPAMPARPGGRALRGCSAR